MMLKPSHSKRRTKEEMKVAEEAKNSAANGDAASQAVILELREQLESANARASTNQGASDIIAGIINDNEGYIDEKGDFRLG